MAGSEAGNERGTGLRCDFCGAQVAAVRRIALDQDYDRLQPPHRELYACPTCSAEKEEARRRARSASRTPG